MYIISIVDIDLFILIFDWIFKVEFIGHCVTTTNRMAYFHVQLCHDACLYRIAHNSTENSSGGHQTKHPAGPGLLNIKWLSWGSIIAAETSDILKVFAYFLEFKHRELFIVTNNTGKLCNLS